MMQNFANAAQSAMIGGEACLAKSSSASGEILARLDITVSRLGSLEERLDAVTRAILGTTEPQRGINATATAADCFAGNAVIYLDNCSDRLDAIEGILARLSRF